MVVLAHPQLQQLAIHEGADNIMALMAQMISNPDEPSALKDELQQSCMLCL